MEVWEKYLGSKWTINCNSEKIVDPLGCEGFDETTNVEEAKKKFYLQFNNYTSKHRPFT